MAFEFKNPDAPAIKEKNKFSFQEFFKKVKNFGTIPLKERLFFVQNLRVMVTSGLPLANALKTLGAQTKNKRFKQIILDLHDSTEKGVSFSDSLKHHRSVFGDLFINMIMAGEASGQLDEVLTELYLQMKKDHDLIAKVKSAMTYPVIVLVAMIGIGTAMMIFVMPKLITVFEEMEAELPFFTRMLIALTNFIANQGALVTVFLVIVAILIIVFIKTNPGKHFWHKVMLNTPIMGKIIKKINIARFTRTVSSLIKTDIPIVETFKITSKILGNIYYQEALQSSSERLVKGESMAKILESYPKLFPPVVCEMTAVGEETGAVDDILKDLAIFYEEEIDETMKTLPSVIEPILMIVLGFGVGAMAVAIIMPMYSLTQQM